MKSVDIIQDDSNILFSFTSRSILSAKSILDGIENDICEIRGVVRKNQHDKESKERLLFLLQRENDQLKVA
jgi:hypothetical protein